MFTVYNNGQYVIHVAFQSAQTTKQIDENLVKRGEYGFCNKTTTTSKMEWIAIDIGKKFTFDMNKLKEFKRGNVNIKYWKWYHVRPTVISRQHIIGKGIEFTSDYELKYCDMNSDEEEIGNNIPSRTCVLTCKSNICAIL